MRVAIVASLLLFGCVSNGLTEPKISYDKQDISYPTLTSFPHCYNYGCHTVKDASLSAHEIKKLRHIFTVNDSAVRERANIQKAVAYLEKTTGAKFGTDQDKAGTYSNMGGFQHDCVDESTNTTTYLLLLEQLGLLRFHQVNALTSRPPIFSGRLGPHRTAVIFEKQSDQKYAIDSWFHDNGIEPEIVLLDKWFWGWHPKSE